MELVTPATQRAIETAIASRDQTTLAKYGRFLAPMIETILRKEPGSSQSKRFSATLGQIYSSYLAQNNLR
jgi:hypothetical protein